MYSHLLLLLLLATEEQRVGPDEEAEGANAGAGRPVSGENVCSSVKLSKVYEGDEKVTNIANKRGRLSKRVLGIPTSLNRQPAATWCSLPKRDLANVTAGTLDGPIWYARRGTNPCLASEFTLRLVLVGVGVLRP